MSNSNELKFTMLELWALYACILEAKFHGADWRDHDVPPSPIVAQIANRIVDVLAGSAEFGNTGSWSDWRTLTPERHEWRVAVRYVEYRGEWLDGDRDSQLDYAKCLLSPFHVSDDLLERFVREAREYRNNLPPRATEVDIDE